jgi:site-specific DNA-adenine methylase
MCREGLRIVGALPVTTYFGGKSQIADTVWSRLGNCDVYLEPFCGSSAVLLARPRWHAWHARSHEVINDADAYVANFWRALKAEPEALAERMDWPVNEVDLEARHKWLVEAVRKEEHQRRMRCEPEYYDLQIAAWWCWGMCAWIGKGWCAGEWHGEGHPLTRGTGVNVNGGKLPHIGPGVGVQRLSWSTLGPWVDALSARMRRVRVACGDWTRIAGEAMFCLGETTGIFLDPPYSEAATRSAGIYSHDDLDTANDVFAWCVEHGPDPRLRIVLAGYAGEHDALSESHGWSVVAWKAQGGHANWNDGQGKENAKRERIWCSPACIPGQNQGILELA